MVQITIKFIHKLIDSGYDQSTREKIIKAGIRKYYRGLAKAVREGFSFYRSRQEMMKSRQDEIHLW